MELNKPFFRSQSLAPTAPDPPSHWRPTIIDLRSTSNRQAMHVKWAASGSQSAFSGPQWSNNSCPLGPNAFRQQCVLKCSQHATYWLPNSPKEAHYWFSLRQKRGVGPPFQNICRRHSLLRFFYIYFFELETVRQCFERRKTSTFMSFISKNRKH